jgi:hypothetical protein
MLDVPDHLSSNFRHVKRRPCEARKHRLRRIPLAQRVLGCLGGDQPSVRVAPAGGSDLRDRLDIALLSSANDMHPTQLKGGPFASLLLRHRLSSVRLLANRALR